MHSFMLTNQIIGPKDPKQCTVCFAGDTYDFDGRILKVTGPNGGVETLLEPTVADVLRCIRDREEWKEACERSC